LSIPVVQVEEIPLHEAAGSVVRPAVAGLDPLATEQGSLHDGPLLTAEIQHQLGVSVGIVARDVVEVFEKQVDGLECVHLLLCVLSL
jgi:hypothetical protein